MTPVLDSIDEWIRQAREAVVSLEASFAPPVLETLDFLNSPAAQEMVSVDPYWPKWNSPWWQVLLLRELELTTLIPARFWSFYRERVMAHYLPFFPLRESEVPAGKDPVFNVVCHCYLGCFMLLSSELDEASLPEWMRLWPRRYQNKDGGLNCDESKYLKEEPTSSVVSTVPLLEALLSRPAEHIGASDLEFMDMAAEYLIQRRLMRAKRTSEIIDPAWLKPAFPRFYEYDILRGLSVITRWSLKRSRKLSRAVISEALDCVASQVGASGLVAGRSHTQGLTSRFPGTSDGAAAKGPATRFALLDYVDRPGEPSLPLTKEWLGLLLRLKYMSDSRLLGR